VRTNVFLILLSLFFTGCAVAPKDDFERDKRAYPKKVALVDKSQNDLLSYLAAQMLNAEDRNQFFARLQNRYSNDDTLNQGIVNRAIYTRAGDSTGMQLAAGQMVIGAALKMFKSGGMDEVSGIAIPNVVDRIEIKTEDQAWAAATRISENQLRKVAENFNMELSCIRGCDSKRRIYTPTPKNSQVFDSYIYKPIGPIIVMTTWAELKKVESPNPLDKIIRGFTPSWETAKGNMWLTGFYSEPQLDVTGKVVIKTNDKGLDYPEVRRDITFTKLGRDILKLYYSDGGHTYFGDDKRYPQVFAFNGKLYSYIERDDGSFIEYELVEKK
jgi:hypothetical protein